MVYNSKFQKNLPTTRKDQQTRSLNVGNTDQVRFNEQQSRSLQTRYQDEKSFQDHTNRIPLHGNQEKPRYNVPPPNMEKNMIIKEMQKIGINQKQTTQQDQTDQETNRRAVEEMRQSYKAREKTLKEEIENNFRAQIVNLTREKEEQKEANKHNNASSLSKINLQEKQYKYYLKK